MFSKLFHFEDALGQFKHSAIPIKIDFIVVEFSLRKQNSVLLQSSGVVLRKFFLDMLFDQRRSEG